MTGTVLESDNDIDAPAWLAGQGIRLESFRGGNDSAQACYRVLAKGVEVWLHASPTTRPHVLEGCEIRSYLDLFDRCLDEKRSDVLVTFGGDALAVEIRRRARSRGMAVVFALHNFNYRGRNTFEGVDAVIAPSRFAASYYRRALGLDCIPLPNIVDFDRVRVAKPAPGFVTFVNPSYEKGVYPFARIADELGRRRPDIPLLVVEGRGSERTLVDCGLDLRAHGNVRLMANTPDPRRFWGVTKICIMPSLCWESQGLVAVEAMINGIPVIGSDRGGLPETLGDGGIALALPRRLTPMTRELPTPEEVSLWVKAVIGLWDDPSWYEEQSRRAVLESRRWSPDVLEPQYVTFFEQLADRLVPSSRRSQLFG